MSARQALEQMLGPLEGGQRAVVRSIVAKKLTLLRSMDATFDIEAQVLEALGGDSGAELLQKRILAELPQTTTPMTLQTSAQRLAGLKASTLYQFCGAKGQTSLDIVSANLSQMLQGLQPRVQDLKASEFFQSVLAVLPLFCQVKIKAGGGVATKVFYGEKALPVLLTEAEDRAASSRLTFSDLNDLHVYAWLLTPAQKAKVDELTMQVLNGLTTAEVKKPTKTTTTAKKRVTKKGGKSEATDEGDADSAVLSLFT